MGNIAPMDRAVIYGKQRSSMKQRMNRTIKTGKIVVD